MAVTTALVVGAAVAAGSAAMAADAQSSAAKKAGQAFSGVGNNLQDMNTLTAATGQLMGDNGTNNRYSDMQTAAIKVMQQQMNGQLSQSTQNMLGMRAVESGAAGLGQNAVSNNYAAWMGLSSEQLQQQGVDNYRGYMQQMMGAAQQQMSITYGKQYNNAAVQAGVAQQQGAATAGMWNGIGQIGGALMGGFGGGAGSAIGGASSGGWGSAAGAASAQYGAGGGFAGASKTVGGF